MIAATKLSSSDFGVGWWGRPGITGSFTKTHARRNDTGKPACGARVHPKAEYQWCAIWLKEDYLECERCKKIAYVVLTRENEERKKQIDVSLRRPGKLTRTSPWNSETASNSRQPIMLLIFLGIILKDGWIKNLRPG